jgi:PhnB protein
MEIIMQNATQASAKVQPYLFFDGRCEEALEFYKKAVGAEVEMMMRFCDSPEPAKPGMCTPGSENKIMHSCFRIGNTQVMASDGRALGKPVFQGFALSLSATDEADADRLFNALANGGQVQMPLVKTFFSPRFGMVADRFGVGWMVIAVPPDVREFVISRVFDAPRELLWKCFTEPHHLKQWWGPKGFKVIASKMDLRVGGTYHYALQAPDGPPMWGKFTYREIIPQQKLVFISSFSDEAGGTTRHPLHKDWPLEMLSVFSFEDEPGGKTKFTVRWQPYNATPAELQTFEAGRDGMRQGWSGTMDQLATYLAKKG